jgi:hypothetical protein
MTRARTVATYVAPAPASLLGGGSDLVFFENGTSINTDYTITAGKNAVSSGPITISNSVTVTVPSDSVWVVV